jgi:hypothetical protein
VKHLIRSALMVLAGLLTACAMGPAIQAGQTEAEVLARMGAPTARYQEGTNRLLEYRTSPWGQETYMARIGPDNRVISFEQVLNDQKFGQIAVDQARKEDVLKLVGGPAETSFLSLSQLEVWSYPYKQSGAWNTVMHVHFDRSGVVRKLVTAPDMRFLLRDGAFGGGIGGWGM